jgi:hypothetical protein
MVTAVFLFAMILGSPVDARSSTFVIAAANSITSFSFNSLCIPLRSFAVPILVMRKVCFTPELVTESEKQPRTQKPEILHTSTFNTGQITPLTVSK